jgi:hypothetical protein
VAYAARVSDRPRRHDEILGASVVLTGWPADRRQDVAEALALLSADPVDLDEAELPLVALERTSVEKAERARAVLEEAGGIVELRDAWVPRDGANPIAARPPCPFCGSTATQPFTHAGPAARKRMSCTTCGRTFLVPGGR